MKRILVLLALLGIYRAGADAATVISTQSGNWSSSATWGGNPSPTAGDAVIVNGGFTVTVDVSNAACLSLQLGGSTLGTGSGTLSFAGSSHLTVSGGVTVGVTNNTPGSLAMAAGGTLTCEGFLLNQLGTWTTGTGTIEFTATNTIPSNASIDFNNLSVNGGTTSLSRNVNVNGNLVIASGATLDGGAHTLTIGGDWTNNGTFAGNTGSVIFARNGNQTIAGTGFNTFNILRVNMGASIANTLEVTASNFSAPDGFLTLTNGTFKVSGTFTLANTFITGPSYNIQPTAGLWINNPNVTVTAQAGGVSVRGLLRVSAGSFAVGAGVDNSLDYVAGSSIVVEGGTLYVAGRLTRNNATATTAFTQSGGTVVVVAQGSTDPTFAGFDLGAAGSSFTVSGGSIIVRNATSAPSDFLVAASAANVTGGTLQIGDAGSGNAQVIRINSSRPVGNLFVANATSQPVKPVAQLVGSSLTIIGGMTAQAGTSLNANGLNLTLGGAWADSGVFNGGSGTVTFNGAGAEGLWGTGGETFNGLAIAKSGGVLTMNSSVTVNAVFAATQGVIAVGGNSLTLKGGVTGSGSITSSSSGTVQYVQGSGGQGVLSGSYGNLTFNDFAKTLPSAGGLSIAAAFTAGAGTGHVTAGNTIDFNGGSQAIPAFPYAALTLSGSGTKTGPGPLTVTGSLLVGTGVTLVGVTNLSLGGATHANGGTISADTIAVGPGGTLTNSGTVTSGAALTGPGAFVQASAGILNLGGGVDVAGFSSSAAGNAVTYTGAGQVVRGETYHHLALVGTGSRTLAGLTAVNGNLTLAGTVVVTATGGQTVAGNIVIGAGTSFDGRVFTHFLGGNWNSAGTILPGTATLACNGTGAQTLAGPVLNGLTINNAAGVSLQSDETVSGTLTLTVGTFSAGSHTLTLNGGLSTGAGSLVGGSASNLIIGGTAPGISLPALTVGSFTLNRGAGVVLVGDLAVNGTFTAINGRVTTGAHVIALGSGGVLTEAPGQSVVGNVTTTRNVTSTSGTETFGNIGFDVVLNGISPGVTTVSRTTGTASSGSGHSSIKRYFDVSPATNAGLRAGIVFHYDSTEAAGQNPGIFELYRSRDNGLTWNNLGGIASAPSRTIVAGGINDFSRWSVSDTSNRLGTTGAPTVAAISPASKHAGDPGFTLTVTGTEFVNGKSQLLFNGNPRVTTYVSTGELSAVIPAGDLLVTGGFPVAVVNVGGGSSNAVALTVSAGAAVRLAVETASDGSGTAVSAQSLSAGKTLVAYAIARDTLNNFAANAAADAWGIQSPVGGVVAGDLVPSVDKKSATFTARRVGSGVIRATSGALTSISSGSITVIPGAARTVKVETALDGSGVVVSGGPMTSGSSMTVYAVVRDSMENFVVNIAASGWGLQHVTGGVVPGDLVPSGDGKSAAFTAHADGSASILATSGALIPVGSGRITIGVVAGVAENARPLAIALEQNYPNPFNPSTVIRYQLPADNLVTLVVYDLLGREVATLVNGREGAGVHEVRFDAARLAGGAYFYRLVAGEHVETRRMLLVR